VHAELALDALEHVRRQSYKGESIKARYRVKTNRLSPPQPPPAIYSGYPPTASAVLQIGQHTGGGAGSGGARLSVESAEFRPEFLSSERPSFAPTKLMSSEAEVEWEVGGGGFEEGMCDAGYGGGYGEEEVGEDILDTMFPAPSSVVVQHNNRGAQEEQLGAFLKKAYGHEVSAFSIVSKRRF